MAGPQIQRPSLVSIGFFHCGYEGSRNGLKLLRATLKASAVEHVPLSGSLIVLPEAFNLDDYYGKFSPDPSVKSSLAQISVCMGIAFVAGLIQRKTNFNCAYLIDGPTCQVLSYKTDPGRSGSYRPCPRSHDICRLHRGLAVGALVCNDAGENSTDCTLAEKHARHDVLARKLADLRGGGDAVMCVPAYMGAVSSELVVAYWGQRPGLIVVLANGRSTQPSVMRRGDATICSEKKDAILCLRNLNDRGKYEVKYARAV